MRLWPYREINNLLLLCMPKLYMASMWPCSEHKPTSYMDTMWSCSEHNQMVHHDQSGAGWDSPADDWLEPSMSHLWRVLTTENTLNWNMHAFVLCWACVHNVWTCVTYCRSFFNATFSIPLQLFHQLFLPLRRCQMTVMTSWITGQSNVCSAVCLD